MKKLTFLLLVCLCGKYCQAQVEIKNNTFGGFGVAVVSPQGYYHNNVNTGFQINAEINGRIYRPLWFYFEAAYENLAANNAIVQGGGSVSTLGADAGPKLFLSRFLYVSAGAGLRGVLSGNLHESDNTTFYSSFGVGVYPINFLGIYANYVMWQTQDNNPSKNYFIGGVKLSFGHRR